MRIRLLILAACVSAITAHASAEQFSTSVTGVLDLSADAPEGSSVWITPGDSVLIRLQAGTRFFTGVEVRLSAPMTWFAHQGSLALTAYADLDRVPPMGISELAGRRIASELLPGRIQTIYQIPVRQAHGLRTGPYSTVPSDVTLPTSFPALFRLMPVVQVMNEELAGMSFLLSARPILSDEGAVRVIARYPDQLRGRPFTVLINNMVVENLSDEWLLREGEHHLAVVSEDYRNESRRFVVERARTVDLVIDLQDPTPLIFFEAPQNTQIFLNNSPIFRGNDPIPVEPGVHEARFHVGDFTITRTIMVQRGRTYRIALTVGIDIQESD
ncbi:MAG: hypothetical protein FWB78_03830 [Treponema sp.]|nr:hypothetical protein [Treponema sp.]